MNGRLSLGRWCGNCKTWVAMSERVCPSCRNRLRAPEAMPGDAAPITKESPTPPRGPVLAQPVGIPESDEPADGLAPSASDEFGERAGSRSSEESGGSLDSPTHDQSSGVPGTWYPQPETHQPTPSPDPGRRRTPASPVTGWSPELPPIPGVDDVEPVRAGPGSTVTSDSVDGIPRNLVFGIVGGAIVLFIVGALVLGGGSGGEGSPPSADVAAAIEFDDPVAFEAPPVPELPEFDEPVLVPSGDWDPAVADLIPFIEQQRRLRFTEPVEVKLLGTQELFDEFNIFVGDDPFMEEELRFVTSVYRSLGIYEGEIDAATFLARGREVSVTGLYSPTDDIVYVNREVGDDGSGPGGSPFQRAVLVHELTHALQDQHVDLERRSSSLSLWTMQLLMIEGDARRVERAYVQSLSDAEQDQYWSAMSPIVSYEGLDGVLGIEGQFIYEGGLQVNRLVDALAGLDQINVLLRYPPDRPAQLLRASTLFLASQEPWNQSGPTARRPSAPSGAFEIGGGSFGAWLWHVALASRIDPLDAVRAADAIGSDAFMLFERDGQICGRFVIAAADPVDLGHLARGFRAWAAALPHGAEVDIDGQTVIVTTCDPGAGAAMAFAAAPDEIVGGPIARTGAVADVLERQQGWWADDSLRERERWCLTESVQRALTLDEATSGLSDERIDALGEAAVTACLPDRMPGGPAPFDGDCSAAGRTVELDDEGLPDAVAQARRDLVAAAVDCDFGALRELFVSSGSVIGDGSMPAPDSGGALVDRWRRLEDRRRPILDELVTTLESSWICGPGVARLSDDRAGEACVFVSGGDGPVATRPLVSVIGIKGGFLGFGANSTVQEEALLLWSDAVAGSSNGGELTTPVGSLPGPLPPGWPIGVPAAARLSSD